MAVGEVAVTVKEGSPGGLPGAKGSHRMPFSEERAALPPLGENARERLRRTTNMQSSRIRLGRMFIALSWDGRIYTALRAAAVLSRVIASPKGEAISGWSDGEIASPLRGSQ
ncbi:MAG: hypothetical protein H5T61_09365 [Thermoflexales bacterium]|nr:hypothetical protein [Thermoflexales bacterium]